MTSLLPVILIVDNSVAVTGALKAVLNNLEKVNKEFQFVFVLPASTTATSLIEEKGHSVTTLNFIEISKRIPSLIGYVPALIKNGYLLNKIAKAENAQIIHMNDFYNLTGIMAKLFGFRGSLLTHVRFVPHRFGALAKVWSFLNRLFADRILCVSQVVKSFFPENDPKILLLHDPLPMAEKYPVPNPPAANETINLLYLSNFIQGKGQNFALEAFHSAYRLNPGLRLTFIGGDMGLEKNRDFKANLEAKTQELGLAEVVSFRAFSDDVERDIKQADIVLNFSESESFSLTCLEALYYGTPLIASDSGGPAELFENGKSGILVANRDANEMARAILLLASDYQMRERFSREGRQFVTQKFGPANTTLRLAAIYRDLLTNPN